MNKTVLGVFWTNLNSEFFRKHPKLFCLYLSNQISLRGRFVFKTNGRISSITSYKDHYCSFFTSWVIKQQTKLYIEHFEKTPNFGRMVRTPKLIFRVLQIISRVLQVPIFRNNFHFGWKVFTFSVPTLQKFEKFDVRQGQTSKNLNDAIYFLL